MADYTETKAGPGVMVPERALDTSWKHVEPLVTPQQVRGRHLFGIPMVSAMRDPLTNKPQVYTDDLIKDTIDRAVAQLESEAHIDVFPVQRDEKAAFDRAEYQQFGYFKTRSRPVASIESLAIVPPTNEHIYEVPLQWVETSYLRWGQINLIPLGNAVAYSNVAQVGSGGALFLSIFGQQPWTPAFWNIRYTSGYPDGLVPKIVNELIGVIAAMEVLSQLAATYGKSSGHSLGIDGLSQSISTPGPQIFKVRMDELQLKRDKFIKKVKVYYGQSLMTGSV
jgi:hypothetical protein